MKKPTGKLMRAFDTLLNILCYFGGVLVATIIVSIVFG